MNESAEQAEIPQEPQPPSGGIHYFSISPEDLQDLERMTPEICRRLEHHFDNRLSSQFRRICDILSRVRWNYGPLEEVYTVPAG